MLLVINRIVDEYMVAADTVYEFDTEEKLDAWLSRFEQVVEPGSFAMTVVEKSEPVELPSYDDPDSTWERPDHVRLVKRILNSKVKCWHCNSTDITIENNGWVCVGCNQYGPWKDIMEDLPHNSDEGCFRNLPYRDFDLPNAEAAWHFARPYVCVVHGPTGKGYYLDRRYQLIGSVNRIVTPPRDGGSVDPDLPRTLTRCLPYETIDTQAASLFTPNWAVVLPCKEFTSFWLY